MTCPNCKAEVPPGARFCTNCGQSLGENAEFRRLRRDRRLLTWIGLGLVGGTLLACNILLAFLSAPDAVALTLSSLAAIIPAFLYARLVLRLDRYEREPRRTVLACFFWGALFATFAAGILNAIGYGVAGAAVGPDEADKITATFVAPVVEETLKGLALLLLVLIFRDEFDNMLDGLVYGALVGLGFAMTENIFYFSAAFIEDGALGFGILVGLRTITGMFGHAMWTGLTGAAIGWGRSRHGAGAARFIVPLLAWCGAMLQHGLWNGLLSYGGDAGSFFAALGFLVLGFVLVFVIWRVSLRREQRIIAQYLADEVPNGVLTSAEFATLTDEKARRRALKAARKRGGRRMKRLQQAFFQASAELAFRKYHLSNGERPKTGHARTPEEEYRAELQQLRVSLAEQAAGR